MLKNCLKVFSVGRAIHLQRVTSVIILNRRGKIRVIFYGTFLNEQTRSKVAGHLGLVINHV